MLQTPKSLTGSARKAIAWATLVLLLAAPCFDVVARPVHGILGEQARRAIDQWPAAQQADKSWEWLRTLVYLVQIALVAQGFDPGKSDGLMGPNTMMALLEWRKKNGKLIAPGLDPSRGIADIVAQLLHEALATMGLSPGPRDQILGWRATSALEDWSSTFHWGALSMDIGAHRVAREQVMEDFGQAPLSEAEKPAAAPQAATPSEPATRNPERGELWAAYLGYDWDTDQGDSGFGLAWNYPSREEAIAAARSQCEQRQPLTPPRLHLPCGHRIIAISTTATEETITVDVPSDHRRGYRHGDIKTYVRNGRCFAVSKDISYWGRDQIYAEYHKTGEEAVNLAESYWGDAEGFQILKVVCNDW